VHTSRFIANKERSAEHKQY